MHKNIRHNLKKKGWSDKRIRHASKITKRAHRKRAPALKFLDSIIDYSILFSGSLLIIGVAILLFPVMLVFNDLPLYFSIAIISGGIGLLYSFLAIELLFLEKKHHYLFIGIVPVIGFITMHLVVRYTNKMIPFLSLDTQLHSPTAISLIYPALFMAPFVSLFLYYKIKHLI